MLSLTAGSHAYAGTQILYAALRQFMTYVVWAVTAALVASALCWCCGCGARAAWTRVGPPSRRVPQEPPADDVALEAARGIHQIEVYLSAQADPR